MYAAVDTDYQQQQLAVVGAREQLRIGEHRRADIVSPVFGTCRPFTHAYTCAHPPTMSNARMPLASVHADTRVPFEQQPATTALSTQVRQACVRS